MLPAAGFSCTKSGEEMQVADKASETLWFLVQFQTLQMLLVTKIRSNSGDSCKGVTNSALVDMEWKQHQLSICDIISYPPKSSHGAKEEISLPTW